MDNKNNLEDLLSSIKNAVKPIVEFFSSEKFTIFTKSASEYNRRIYNKHHVRRISKFGWTINYFTARIADNMDHADEFNKAMFYEYIRDDTIFHVEEIIETIKRSVRGNSLLFDQLQENIMNKNYSICLPTLVMLIEREVRLISEIHNSESWKVKKYFKDKYKENNKNIREYSIYLYLEKIFFSGADFDKPNYNNPINRHLMQHGMYEIDNISELHLYQLINVMLTLVEIKSLNK